MPFIEIITDSKSQTQLNKVITKKMVNDCDILFIKDKNIENTKNIKLRNAGIKQKCRKWWINEQNNEKF